MKQSLTISGLLILVALCLIALSNVGCAKKEDSAPQGHTCSTLAGMYESNANPSDTLTLNTDCTLTDSRCGYDASYTVPAGDWTTSITINNTNGAPACLSNTAHACQLEYDSGTGGLAIECDGGAYLTLWWKQ